MIDTLAHYFIPRPSNNHKAKTLHSSTLAIIIILFLSLQLSLNSLIPKSGRVLGYAANISPTEVERLTNVQRKEHGLNDLMDNPNLDAAALAKGRDMLAKGYWAHVAPDGTQPWAFFVNANYEYRYAGENLARDFSDASSAVNAWMASPSHRENMLSPNYKEIGIGVVEGQMGGMDTTIIVQFFGTKLGDKLPVQPVAQTKTTAPSPSPISVIETPEPRALVASTKTSPFQITKYLSFVLVGGLILVVAIDGFLINKRKIFRLGGHWEAHVLFLGGILAIVLIAKAGRII